MFYLPGMAGMLSRDRRFCQALREAGLDVVHEVNWVRWPWALQLVNLRDRRGHMQAAERVVSMINDEAADREIVLIGHSTGAMVVLDALQQMSRPVHQAWWLAAAISRRVDLRPALANVGKLISLHSRGDRFHLQFGTWLVGAADGVHGRSCGALPHVGPGCDDSKFEQRDYEVGWRELGHRGGHLSVLSERFAAEYVGPAILGGGIVK
ncbi:alpha/beta hydrolase [Planctomycetales bacterium ZRK34]|nr:alpha/beta hydrolase [Planctomycetales bacterium ZRK34]